MTGIDWIIVGFTLLMAVWGYAQGLVVGVLSLVGFVGGGFLGSRLAPLLLHGGAHSPFSPLFALLGAFALGGILASILEIVGFRLRRYLRGPLGAADGFGGAVLIAAAGLVICWIAGAVALQTPGARGFRRDIQRSAILRRLNQLLPPSAVLHALARFDPFPKVTGPPPEVPAPTSGIARKPGVLAAGRSVVKILGTACGLGIEGSGWVARSGGVVVTNAHVVAGESDTTVELGGQGPRYSAQPIWFDPHDDVALLKSGGLASAQPLPIRVDAPPGTSAAVLGFPENGPFDIRPARLGATTEVITEDAYGRGPVRRNVTALRGLVRSGNSGGPLVDARGRVLATIFAATTGGPQGGYAVPDSVVLRALQAASSPVGTGPCAR
ncbi:MAG: MarP family serine protease [Actinobacteria bacterium]|nr:MarP family serine protease [Actinomycetota bacterium]